MGSRTTATSTALALNVALLRQGVDLLERIDDAAFARIDPLSPGGGLGRQLRHCLDFYASFLRGLPVGRIDYVHRERSRRIETDRRFALRKLVATIDALESIDGASCAEALDVRAEESADLPGATGPDRRRRARRSSSPATRRTISRSSRSC